MSDVTKRAFKKAVKEIDREKVDEIKVLVKQALEAKEKAERDRRDAVRRIQLIKQDLEDLKRGRLQLIKERHEKDKQADKLSPISVEKVKQILLPYRSAFSTTTANWIAPQTTTITSGNTMFPYNISATDNIAYTLNNTDPQLNNV